MISVRLALESDEDAVVELARQHYTANVPYDTFDEVRARRTFDLYLATATPTIFVAESKGELIGFLMALIHDYACSNGHFTTTEVIYVRPDKCGTRAAAELVQTYILWADEIGAKESFVKLAENPRLESNVRFMQRFGFQIIGLNMKQVKGAA